MFNSYKKIIRVEGMTCEHCANRVKNAFCDIDGVKKVKVIEKLRTMFLRTR